jgi:type IV pilus assembly protein PilO
MKPLSISLWFTGASLALAAGVHLLIIRPAAQKRDSLERDAAVKRSALVNVDRAIESSRVIAGEINELRPRVALFDLRLGSARDTNSVLADLWHMADTNSLQTRSVKTPASLRSESFTEQEIDLTVAGSFGGYYQFMLQLEDMQRIVRVKKMNLSKVNATDGQVQAELTVSVYCAAGPT